MRNRQAIIYIIGILLLLPTLSISFQLRQLKTVPLNQGDEVFGRSTGNIIIASNSGLKFLDRRWNIRSEITVDSSEYSVIAPNGLFYATGNKIIIDSSGNTANALNIFSFRQIPTWSAYDLSDGKYFLSPSGDYVVVICGQKGGYDYEMDIAHIDRKTIKCEIEYFNGILFSPDGKYLIIDSGPKGTKLYDANGNLIMTMDYQKDFAFSESKDLAAFFENGEVTVIDKGKTVLKENYSRTILNDMAIRDNPARLFLAFGSELVAADAGDGRVLWKYPTNIENGKYMSVDVSPNGKFVAGGVDVSLGSKVEIDKRHVQGFIHVYDIDGLSVEQFEINYSKYGLGMPDVVFSPDNRTMVVRTQDSLHVISIY